MRKLTNEDQFVYEIVEGEVVVYLSDKEGNPDFDAPAILNDIYIANAFSLQMVPANCDITVRDLSQSVFNDIRDNAEHISCVGHPDTARVLGVEQNRESISLQEGDALIVAQLEGGRLPEGATELPEGFRFGFRLVEIAA